MNTFKSNCILLTTTLLLFTISSLAQGDIYLTLGNNAFQQKDYQRAIEHYDKCLASNPKHTGCLFNRGLSRKIAVSFKLAVEDFSAIIAMQPTDAKAFEQRGSCYEAMNQDNEALIDFNRAIELNPRNANAYWYRGRLFKKKKDAPRALADFSKMIEVAPNDERGYEGRAHIYRELKENDKAINDYNQALQRVPNDALNLYSRGAIYFEQGKSDLAEADFNRAIALDKSYEIMVNSLKTLAKNKEISERTRKILENNKPQTSPATTTGMNANGAFGLWQATLQFGTATRTYSLFLEPANVQSPSVMFIVNAERYELKNVKLNTDGAISFDLLMGKSPVFFTGTFEAGAQKMTGQFSYTREGKSVVEKWYAQRLKQN